MRTKLNPKEAPKGYLAAPAKRMCQGCAFDADGVTCERVTPSCLDYEREDSCEIIFIKTHKRPRPKATFEQWWKRQLGPPHGYRSTQNNIELARRAYAAGRRSMK